MAAHALPALALPDVAALAGLDVAVGAALRAQLTASGYDSACVDRVERAVPGPFDLPRLPLIARLLAADVTSGAALAALFAYDLPVPLARAEAALGAVLPALLDLGVLRAEAEGRVRSAWRLVPFHGLWLLSDRPDAGPDAVMGPGPTTAALARAALPAAAGTRVLDLGCGAGSLALVAVAGGAVAVATDLSARAVAVAAANARLNGLALDVRCGDGFAPVAGERFDLVLCQPPYVIRPAGATAVTYLHGGARGDELARQLAAATPSVLAEHGLAVLSFDAPLTEQEDLAAAIAEEIAGAADVVVLAWPGPGLDQLAMAYASVADPSFGTPYAQAAERYRQHCADQGFRRFQRNLVLLRQPARGFAMQVPAAGSARLRRPTLDRLLAAIDAAALPDADLNRQRVAPVSEARLVVEQPFAGGAPHHRVVFSSDGWCSDHELSDAAALLCTVLAQSADVSAAAATYAQTCGAAVTEVAPQVLGFVRDGLRRGLLALAESAP